MLRCSSVTKYRQLTLLREPWLAVRQSHHLGLLFCVNDERCVFNYHIEVLLIAADARSGRFTDEIVRLALASCVDRCLPKSNDPVDTRLSEVYRRAPPFYLCRTCRRGLSVLCLRCRPPLYPSGWLCLGLSPRNAVASPTFRESS